MSTSSGSHWRRVGQCLLMHPGQRDSDSPQHGAHEQPLPLLLQAEPEITLGQRRLHAGWANDAKTVCEQIAELGTATSSEQLICQSSNTPLRHIVDEALARRAQERVLPPNSISPAQRTPPSTPARCG